MTRYQEAFLSCCGDDTDEKDLLALDEEERIEQNELRLLPIVISYS